MDNRHLVAIALLLLVAVQTQAYPWRQKRVSDQRLAELETLLTLARLKGKLVTVPIGYGLIDPAKIGRRKRSHSNADLPEVEMVSFYGHPKFFPDVPQVDGQNSQIAEDEFQDLQMFQKFQKFLRQKYQNPM